MICFLYAPKKIATYVLACICEGVLLLGIIPQIPNINIGDFGGVCEFLLKAAAAFWGFKAIKGGSFQAGAAKGPETLYFGISVLFLRGWMSGGFNPVPGKSN